ncbi:MAG: PQQ-dependent sugar dehydrogenase [Planctomycetota bacterium]|nr:PQQ-dependent sugar dehydrogenase [Planctomycetota bacterium]
MPDIALAEAFPALRFKQPVDLVFAPKALGMAYVLEQNTGQVRVFDARDDVAEHSLFLDLSDRMVAKGGANEEGLLALALAPDFAASGVFCVYYIGERPSHGVLSRFRCSDPRVTVTADSEEVLLSVAQPWKNHNGADLVFGPDGMLYFSLGDGGSGGDPKRHGQNLGSLLGTVLRLDVSAPTGYRVPADNPFVGQEGVRPEIWAYGLRNTWRMSFDRATGALWGGDVGQNAWEEIDIIVAGGNYGWNLYEGTRPFHKAPRGLRAPEAIPPVFEYDRSMDKGGRSVTGGYVYRGSAFASLQGVYLCADYVSGNVWGLPADDPSTVRMVLRGTKRICSFAEDSAGELYVVEHGGALKRVVVP